MTSPAKTGQKAICKLCCQPIFVGYHQCPVTRLPPDTPVQLPSVPTTPPVSP